MDWAGILDILSWILLTLGGVFFVIGSIGLVRMPDVFTRMHATSVSDTLGAGLLIAGMLLQAGPTLVAVKLIMILLVLLLTGPVATHALTYAALNDKMEPLLIDSKGKLVETRQDDGIIGLEDLQSEAEPDSPKTAASKKKAP